MFIELDREQADVLREILRYELYEAEAEPEEYEEYFAPMMREIIAAIEEVLLD